MVIVARRTLLAGRGRLVMSVAGVAFALLLVLIILAGLPVAPATRERSLPAPGHVTVDSVLAGKAGLAVGDAITALGRRLVVERNASGRSPARPRAGSARMGSA